MRRILAIISLAGSVAWMSVCVYADYDFVFKPLTGLKLVLDRPEEKDFVVYLVDSTGTVMDFKRPVFPIVDRDSSLLFDFGRPINIRQFRLYVQRPIVLGRIDKIILSSEEKAISVDLGRLQGYNLELHEQLGTQIQFSAASTAGVAYFESKRFLYDADIKFLIVSLIASLLVGYLIYRFLVEVDKAVDLKSFSIEEWAVGFFICSVFLRQDFFNVSLAVSSVVICRRFRFNAVLTSRMGLLYLGYYLVIISNYFLSTPSFSLQEIEKYTPFLFLPLYVSCIKSNRLLIFFCVSAIIIGLGFLIQGFVSFSIFRSLSVLSFDEFTGSVHPVYFSYVLVFSMLYIELETSFSYKRLFHAICLTFLVLSGSKLVLVSLVVGVLIVRKRYRLVTLGLLVLSLIVFQPLRDRMGSVLGVKDLSVVSEIPVANPEDPRINGLTMRLMLWQESLSFDGLKAMVWGRGVGATGEDAFKGQLKNRGLTSHLSMNAHNQYLTTYYLMGLAGLIVVMAILYECFRVWNISRRRMILLWFAILFAAAMITESVLERIVGIIFFELIGLLLSRSVLSEKGQAVRITEDVGRTKDPR